MGSTSGDRGVAPGRSACQRAARVLRFAPALSGDTPPVPPLRQQLWALRPGLDGASRPFTRSRRAVSWRQGLGTTGLQRTCSRSAAVRCGAVRCSSWTRPPLVTDSPNWVRRTRVTFSSGMPSSVCNSTTSAATFGPSCRTGRPQRVGDLQSVPALHAPLTLRAMAHLDVEAPHEGTHLGQVFLVLRRPAGNLDRAAAVRTGRRGRRRVRLVNLCRLPSAPMLPVLRTASSPRTPAASLRPVLGEGSCLPASGAPRRLELLLQMLAAALPLTATIVNGAGSTC